MEQANGGKVSLLKSITTVGGWTGISRITGFIRDIIIARFMGATMMADAFFVALRFPNLFRSFFAEGSLNVAFIPLFTESLHKDGKSVAYMFANAAFSFLFYVLLFFTVIMELSMPVLVFLLAPGFDEIAGKMELTVALTRITFPFLLCVSLVSLLSGVLNALGKFWVPAFAPIILNLCMILALFIASGFMEEYLPAYATAIGVAVAGFVQLFWLLWYVRKKGLYIKLLSPIKAIFQLTASVKLLLKKMLPGIFGSGVYQINLFLDTILVSFVGAGAISWLNYAHHIYQLPVGILGSAVGVVLLPTVSKHLKSKEEDKAYYHTNRALELSLTVALGAMVALLFLSAPVVSILFERGLFSHKDAVRTATALMAFAAGLPAYMSIKAMAPLFYGRGDTVTPVKIAVAGVILNAVFALLLMQFWGYVGIALATTISVWINCIQYFYRLLSQKMFKIDLLFKKRILGITGAIIVMTLCLWFFLKIISLPVESGATFHNILWLSEAGLVSGLGLIVGLFVFKVFSVQHLKMLLSKRVK